MTPGLVEAAALAGAVVAGAVVVALAARLETPQTLILFGVALSAMGGAGTALVFNLSPSPIATADVLSWLMGSVANRDWDDVAVAAGPMLLGAALCLWSGRGLRMLTLGPEGAALSGLPMSRLRAAAVAGAALLTGASVAMAGVIGFVGLAAPHLVRGLGERRSRCGARAVGDGGCDPSHSRRSRRSDDPHRRAFEAGRHDGAGRRAAVRPDRLARLAQLAMNGSWRVTGLCRLNSPGRRVVDAADPHRFAPGEVVGLVGCNGSGKTTLLRAALGLVRATRGESRIGGDPVADLSQEERAKRVGYLPQERIVGWNLPAWRVAALGAPLRPPAVARIVAAAALRKVGAAHLADRGVLDLSGGERARVLLARLLATEAPLLILDEPVAGLDLAAQLQTLDILRAHADEGGAVLVTLHDLRAAARHCDRIVVMSEGRVIATAPAREVFTLSVLSQAFGLTAYPD